MELMLAFEVSYRSYGQRSGSLFCVASGGGGDLGTDVGDGRAHPHRSLRRSENEIWIQIGGESSQGCVERGLEWVGRSPFGWGQGRVHAPGCRRMSFSLSSECLPNALLAVSSHVGAVVQFKGWVRDVNEGRAVLSLEYEAFDDLAVLEGNRVMQEAQEKFPLLECACIHRVGLLMLGESAILVEVASAHRQEAFAACQWIVDSVKSRVPIWKREFYADGESVWLDPSQGPAPTT
jgi:molybdopterin synthase catalytic subunit